MQRIEEVHQASIAAIHGESVLREIVGSEAEKVHVRRQPVHGFQGGRGLDHDPERHIGSRAGVQGGAHLVQHLAGAPDLIRRDDEGEEDPHPAVLCGSHRRAELIAEQVGKVEAHPDGAPAEVWILLHRHRQEDRELVAADVERAQRDSELRKSLHDSPVRVVLLVFVGDRSPTDHEKLRPEQAHPFRTHPQRGGRVIRLIQVRLQDHPGAVGRLGHAAGELLEAAFPLARVKGGTPVGVDLGFRRMHDHAPAGAIENHLVTVRQLGQPRPDADDAGHAEGASDHRRVGRPRPCSREEAEHSMTTQLHGQARRQLVEDQNRSAFGQLRDDVPLLETQQPREHALANIPQIGEAIERHDMCRVGEAGPELQETPVDGPLGRQVVLADVGDRSGDQIRVVEHHGLRLEDLALDGSNALARYPLDLQDAPPGPLSRILEALHLGVDLIGTDRSMRHGRHVPACAQGVTVSAARRRSDSVQHPAHWPCSPSTELNSSNSFSASPRSIRWARASNAASASSPTTRRRSFDPDSAASISTPMMLLPLTSSPSFSTHTSDR